MFFLRRYPLRLFFTNGLKLHVACKTFLTNEMRTLVNGVNRGLALIGFRTTDHGPWRFSSFELISHHQLASHAKMNTNILLKGTKGITPVPPPPPKDAMHKIQPRNGNIEIWNKLFLENLGSNPRYLILLIKKRSKNTIIWKIL